MLKSLGLIIISFILSLVFGFILSGVYDQISGHTPDGFFAPYYALVLPIIAGIDLFFFFYILLVTMFIDKNKYLLNLIILIPFVVIELLLAVNSRFHLISPIILGFAGWLIGYLILQLKKRLVRT